MSGVNKRVDVSKLEHASLVKYCRMYRLPEYNRSREDLIHQVSRHLGSQQFMLNEEDVLVRFIKMLKADIRRKRPTGSNMSVGNYGGRMVGKKL